MNLTEFSLWEERGFLSAECVEWCCRPICYHRILDASVRPFRDNTYIRSIYTKYIIGDAPAAGSKNTGGNQHNRQDFFRSSTSHSRCSPFMDILSREQGGQHALPSPLLLLDIHSSSSIFELWQAISSYHIPLVYVIMLFAKTITFLQVKIKSTQRAENIHENIYTEYNTYFEVSYCS